MKNLNEYINEGIFDMKATDPEDLLFVDSILMITKPGGVRITPAAIRKAFDNGTFSFDPDAGALIIKGVIDEIFINKAFIEKYGDAIKSIEFDVIAEGKPGIINFLSDLSGVDMGGMMFKSNRFYFSTDMKLVNMKLCCLSNATILFFLDTFSKVEISIADKIKKIRASAEFMHPDYPKVMFASKDADRSNVFDNVTLIGSSSDKFNVSLACTTVGQKIRTLTQNKIPIDSTDGTKINALLKSSRKAISEVTYLYRNSDSGDGEGFIYDPAAKSSDIREFGGIDSDYIRCIKWYKAYNVQEYDVI